MSHRVGLCRLGSHDEHNCFCGDGALGAERTLDLVKAYRRREAGGGRHGTVSVDGYFVELQALQEFGGNLEEVLTVLDNRIACPV